MKKPVLFFIIQKSLIQMYKKIFIIIIFFLFSGCKMVSFIKHLSEQEFITHSNVPQNFELSNNDKILLNVSLNNSSYQMIFDTRATSILFKSKNDWIDTLPEINAPKFMRPKVATGERINRSFVKIQTAQCDIFTAKNWIVPTIKHLKQNCNNIIGIVGHDDFSIGIKKERKILEINFDKQEILLINEIPKEWIKIKSKFNIGYTKIFLLINGNEYSFGFDTGFNGQVIFSKKNTSSHIGKLKTKDIRYGQMFKIAGGENVNDTIEIKNAKKVFLNDSSFVENIDIILTDKIMENLIGIGFIKNYNWIIDYKESSIYIQQRKTDITENINYPLEYLGITFSFNTNSVVVRTLSMSGRAEKAGFKVGDKVLSINNINISNIPICKRNYQIKEIIKEKNEMKIIVERKGKILIKTINSNN